MRDTDPRVPISIAEATRLGISRLVQALECGREHVILRDNKAVATVISIERLDEMGDLEDTLIDVSVAFVRILTTSARRHSLDDVLTQLGYSRDDLCEADG